MKTLYKPKDEPMRVVALFSGGASGAYDLLSNPNPNFEVVGGICKRADAGGIAKLGLKFAIPIVVYDIRSHHTVAGQPIKNNMEERVVYDNKLELFLTSMRPDVLIGSGDMYVNTWSPWYPILNVHPACLNRLDENNKRLFTGDYAVLDAILYGEKETRSTVHLMTDEVDGGPIITRSTPLPVEPSIVDLVSDIRKKTSYEDARKIAKALRKGDLFKRTLDKQLQLDIAPVEKLNNELGRKLSLNEFVDIAKIMRYADVHQSIMKNSCDTPAFMKALELVAKEGLRVDESKEVLYLGNQKLEYGGIELEAIV